MIEHLAHYKVEHFFNSSFVKDLIKISIIKNSDGSYELFDKYTITAKNKKYVVEIKHIWNTLDFYSLQNAVTWCIYCQKNRFIESDRIHSLDKILEGINFSILSLKSKLKKAKTVEAAAIYSDKLSEDEAKQEKLLYELNSYRSQANYWQTHHFRV